MFDKKRQNMSARPIESSRVLNHHLMQRPRLTVKPTLRFKVTGVASKPWHDSGIWKKRSVKTSPVSRSKAMYFKSLRSDLDIYYFNVRKPCGQILKTEKKVIFQIWKIIFIFFYILATHSNLASIFFFFKGHVEIWKTKFFKICIRFICF